jgi:acyl-CoA synthetase (NDP forming)
MAEYAEWKRRPQGHLPDLAGVDRARALRLVAGHEGWLDAETAQGVLAAYRIPFAAPGSPQEQHEGAVEVVIAAELDPDFGPLVTFRLGGPALELMGDEVSRIVPITDLDAAELVRSIKGSPLLFGYRGAAPVDVSALEDVVLRVGRLVDDVPEIAELVLDPVVVGIDGVVARGVTLRASPWHARMDVRTRRLR